MSKQVDERVVSMQFDNKDFEKNVGTTMSTLDKLKAKLNFKDCDKSLGNLSKAASNVDMSTLSKSVDAVHAKFSALEVMGVTALANITNSAVNAGKNLVKSLSVDQITAGWNKYGQKTASVQTIMNSTGKSIDEVNQYLEKLMWFSDETSYGFTDMTAALGQMTSSGGDIEKLIPLITGVANATAYAGKGATEFSRVMYNLNQSYGAGYLQLMDWKSLELAGVGSKQLKQTLIDTAVEMGKISEGSVTIGTFAESLKDKWADREVMETAFGKFGEFSDAVHEMVASGEVDTAAEAIEKLEGKYGDLAVTAFKSAQEAKTFTEAIDATKDAVSSQWMKTMELLFGNYEQAKKIWTDLANALWDIFAGGGESRNELLEKALNYSPVNALAEKLEKVTGLTESMTNKLLDYSDITNRIIAGEFGVTEERWNKLSEMGYDWMHAQNLVNEKLGDSHRYATNYTEAQEQQTIQLGELTDAKLKDLGLTEDEIRAYRDLEKESKRTGKSINELLASMKEKDGRTLLTESFYNIGSALKGSIMAVREAFSEIFPPMTAVQLYNFIKGLNELTNKLRLTDATTGELNKTGEKIKRTLKGVFALVDIILTVVGGPVKVAIKFITKALSAMGVGVLDVSANVGDAIVAFRDWIDEVLDYNKIFEKLGELCKPVTKKIRDWVGSFDGTDKIKSSLEAIKKSFEDGTFGDKFASGFEKVKQTLAPIGDALIRLAKAFWQLDGVQSVVKGVKKAFTGLCDSLASGINSIGNIDVIGSIVDMINTLTNWLSGVGTKDGSGKNVVEGIGNGISDGIKVVVDAITKICKAIYDTFCNFFDIHSPSKLMITLGGFLIAGLALGISQGKSKLAGDLRDIFTGMLDIIKDGIGQLSDYIQNFEFSSINWDYIIAAGGILGLIRTTQKVLKITETFANGVAGFGSMCKEAGGLIKDFRDKAFPKKDKTEKRTDAMLKMAISIGILAASVWALAQVPGDKLLAAVGAIAALSVILYALSAAASKLEVKGADFGKLSLMLLGLAGTLWIMATAMKKLEFLDKYNVGPILLGVAGMVGGITVLLLAFGKLTKGTIAKNIHKASMVIAQISVTMLILAGTIKIVSKLEAEPLKKGMSVLVLFGAFVAGMMLTTRLAGQQSKGLARTLIGMAVTMGLLVGVIKLIGTLRAEEIVGGIACMALFTGLVAGLVAVTKLAGPNIKGAGSTLIGIGAAMMLMALTTKLCATMTPDEIKKGVACMTIFGTLCAVLIKVTKGKEGDVYGGAGVILAISIAIGILAGISILMGLISTETLAKGVTAITVLCLGFAQIVKHVKGIDKGVKGTMIALAVCIGLLVGAVIGMSFLDQKKLANATIAMGMMLGLFALTLKAMSTLKTGDKTYKQVMKTLYALAGVIVILGAVLAALSFLPHPERMIPAATGIGILLAALTGSLIVLSKSRDISDKKLEHLKKTLLPLTGIMVLIAGVLTAMSFVKNPESFVPTAVAISLLLITMTGITTALTMLAKSTQGMKWEDLAKPLAMLTALVVPMIAFGGAIALMSGWSFNPEQVIGITATMYAMIPLVAALDLLAKLTAKSKWSDLVKPLVMLTALAGELVVFGYTLNLIKDFECDLAGVLKVVAVMYALTPLVAAIAVVGKVMKATGGVGTLVQGLVGLTVVLGYVGLVIAAIGTVAGLLGLLPDGVKESIARGFEVLKTIAGGIGEIIGAFVGGIASGVMSSLPAIGLALSQFMVNATPFIMGAKLVDGAVAKGVATLVGAILALTVAELIEGIVSFSPFAGNFADLGTQLSQFMINALPFITIASTLSEDMMSGVRCLAEAIILLTGAQLIEGITGWLTGGADLSGFGEQLGMLGSGIKDFADNLKGFDDKTIAAVTCGATALKTIAEACKLLPNSGGLAGAIFGENDAGEFGEQLAWLGRSLKSFVGNIGTFGKEQYSTINYVAKSIKALAKASSEIPNSGGWISDLVGDNDVSTFSSVFSGLGTSLKLMISNVGTFGKEQYNTVKWAADSIKVMAKAAKEIPNMGGAYADAYGDNGLGAFGKELKNFFAEICAVDFSKMGSITAAMEESLKAIGTAVVDSFASAVSSEESKTTILTALEGAVTSASANVQTEEVYDGFKTAGKYCVKGFAEGIDKYTYLAEAKAKAMAEAAEEAAKKELDEHSPSKKFMTMGMYTVLGYVKGVAKYTGEAVDSTVKMAKAIVGGFEDEMEINSPSLKMEKDGHYVVQGVAEGIKNDTSAEDAMRQKAQNITTAFEEEIQKIVHDGNIADKIFQLWELTDGLKATPAETRAKTLENLNTQLQTATHEQRMYYDQWLEMDRYYKKGQVKESDVDTAYDKWYDAQLKVAQTQKEINDLMAYGVMDEDLASHQRGRDTWTKNMEVWLANEGRFASDEEKNAKQMQHSQMMLASYQTSRAIAAQKHAKALERSGGIVNDEVLTAWNNLKDLEKLIGEEEQNIRDILSEASVNAVENVQERMDLRDKEFELWRETDGLYATGARLEAKTKKYLEATLADQTEQLDIEQKELTRLKSIKATEDEIRAQEEKVLDLKIAQAQTQNQINSIAKTALERQKETHELASETADLQYQIWEKTAGREATSAEKDVAKIGMITKQLSAQSSILDVARKEYKDACSDYGKYSNEATAAYNAYLNEQLKLADLQNEIIDIEEKTVAKQKLAKSEYKDYVEKYKKFYELNGMTVEQLEKDAKLVSGYDPNNTIENLVSKTQRKLDEMTRSSEYTKLLDSFSSVGTSYISAINDGVDAGVSGIMNSLETVLNDCQDVMAERVADWETCGRYLVYGFVNGLTSNIHLAVSAAKQLAVETAQAVRSEFDINSPSRVFADISSYAVLGLAKGFIDNCSISADAAAKVGNTAVEAMQNTISRISEAVDSGLDVRPTISPVLDLTDVKSGAATLSSMFSRSQAMEISASMAARTNNAESQNGADKPTGGNTYYNFEQNNYSPKALSRTELYRQTKNQFAAMKGATS